MTLFCHYYTLKFIIVLFLVKGEKNPVCLLLLANRWDAFYSLNLCHKAANMCVHISTFIWQLKSCFGFDTFFATDVRRFGDGGIFVGNLRKPIEEVIPKLEKKLSETAERDVVLWFMEEKSNDITKQVLEYWRI